MQALFETSLGCPYCGESVTVLVDASDAQQSYFEDCPVCCRPMAIRVSLDDAGRVTVEAHSENDA
jgi:hypothetical protein